MTKIYYVDSKETGFRRKLQGTGYIYYSADGKQITRAKILKRIKDLKIPPAYKKVWICSKPNGHIQAYGYDDQNRKQYIYHKQWRAYQEKNKFQHLYKFGKSLIKIRRKVEKNLKLKKLSKRKVIAAAIKMLDKTTIRIGSPQYHSFGLLTIRKKHIKIKGSTIILDFEGKSKKQWHVEVYDKKLSDLIKRFEKNPGYTIFKYCDEKNELKPLKVSDINDYLKKITHENITAKEFRTWKGSLYYLHCLLKYKNRASETIQRICIEKTAKALRNTAKICKQSYIHPLLLQANINNKLYHVKINNSQDPYLSREEKILLSVFKLNI